MVDTVEAGSARAARPDRLLVLGLGAAVAYGALRSGGFHTGDGATVLLLVGVAAAARVRRRGPVPREVAVAVTALLGLAAWAAGGALLRDGVGDALPTVAVAAGLAAAAWVATGVDAAGRRVLHAVVAACGVVVAATGWLGVVLHVEPLALLSSGLWRASSTLTYANSTAAFLVLALLLAVVTVPGGRPRLLVVSVLLLGLVATMSRAGALTLAVGVAVLLASAPHRARLRALVPVVPAVAVAAAGLLPGLPEGSDPQPLPAVLGLAGGLAVLLLGRRARLVVAVAGVGAAVLLAPAGAATAIADTRLTATSLERADLTRVTAGHVLAAPLAGTGAGRLDLVYVDHRGALVRAEYTHNEYLEVAAETGLVGLVLAATPLVALAVGATRRWRSAAGPPALALVAAFAVHSATDFLWHIPVLPLLLVVGTVPLLTRSLEEP